MARNLTFQEWTGNATEAELKQMKDIVKKRYHLLLLISLIPLINVFTMGFCIFCYNNLNLLKTRGASMGSDLWRGILTIYGLLIFPILEVQLCAHVNSVGLKVLGWDKI